MKIGKDFNTLTLKEYFHYIENHKKFTDFNTLGLYRSIGENSKLSLEEKIELREYAHSFFRKSFDFLQLKDPGTYFIVSTLGQTLTTGEERQFWKELIAAQELILKNKKLNHRNFGVYSKHKCGWDECAWNGMMVREGTYPAWARMHFQSDKPENAGRQKSKRLKKEGRKVKSEIRKETDL